MHPICIYLNRVLKEKYGKYGNPVFPIIILTSVDATSVPWHLYIENRAIERTPLMAWFSLLPSREPLTVNQHLSCSAPPRSLEGWAVEEVGSGSLRGWDCPQSRQLADPDFLGRDDTVPRLILVTSAESELQTPPRWKRVTEVQNELYFCDP